jgi:uncharacterized DUF497 family protein
VNLYQEVIGNDGRRRSSAPGRQAENKVVRYLYCNYNIIMTRFEWNEAKNRINQREHGISFEEAQSVFFDDDALEFPDPDHSSDKDRFLLLGRSYRLRILVICHCFRVSESVIRIISARKATPKERRTYGQRGKL